MSSRPNIRNKTEDLIDNPPAAAVRYGRMTVAAEKIQEEMRHLPLEDMLVLHAHLIESIHQKESTEEMDPSFRDEIRRRVEDIDAGKTEGLDAYEALKKM